MTVFPIKWGFSAAVSHVSLNLSLLSSHISDSPEVRIEETWKPSGESFEVELQCHVTAYPSAKVRIESSHNILTGKVSSVFAAYCSCSFIRHMIDEKVSVIWYQMMGNFFELLQTILYQNILSKIFFLYFLSRWYIFWTFHLHSGHTLYSLIFSSHWKTLLF